MDETVKRPKEKKIAATTDYVDTSIDAQRQYSENLFARAEARVMKVLDEMVEVKLKNALTIIRPTLSVDQMPTLRQMNDDALRQLAASTHNAVMAYQRATGLRVRYLAVTNSHEHGDVVTVRPIVANI